MQAAFAQSNEDGVSLQEANSFRRWEVAGEGASIFKETSARSEETERLKAGTILSNMGCSETDGRIWCNVRPIQGGAKGFVELPFLQPARGPDGIVPLGKNDSKQRARMRDFDLSAEIQCAQEAGQSLGGCRADVTRSDGGDATVLVTFPNGFARSLYFVHGTFVSASATMSGVGRDTEWRIEDNIYVIRVDDQRYNVPEHFVLGR